MKKTEIALLTGGFSEESNISFLSSEKVFEWIDKSLYNVRVVVITRESWMVIIQDQVMVPVDKNDFSFTGPEGRVRFDLAVFFPLHGPPAEDGKIQGYLDMLGIPYTGCGVLASAVSFDKAACKRYIAGTGVSMARSELCLRDQNMDQVLDKIHSTLNLPVFVKPNKHGSSYGVTKVMDAGDLGSAIKKGFEFDDEVLVEEFISGREFSCGVYTLEGETLPLPPTEIISETGFFDFEAKYHGKSREVTPAELPEEKTREMQTLAKRIYLALGCKTLSRIDFILNGETFYFLEANTTPGMTNESLVPQQVRAAGMDVATFINSLIKDRLESK